MGVLCWGGCNFVSVSLGRPAERARRSPQLQVCAVRCGVKRSGGVSCVLLLLVDTDSRTWLCREPGRVSCEGGCRGCRCRGRRISAIENTVTSSFFNVSHAGSCELPTYCTVRSDDPTGIGYRCVLVPVHTTLPCLLRRHPGRQSNLNVLRVPRGCRSRFISLSIAAASVIRGMNVAARGATDGSESFLREEAPVV